METAKKLIDNSVLQEFVPLNALSETHLMALSGKLHVEACSAGEFLFRSGDRDQQNVYLLEGQVELLNQNQKAVAVISAGSSTASHPLAHRQPRQLSACAKTPVRFIRVDSSLLDVFLAWSETSGYNVEDINAQQNDDWLTRLLQSDIFARLPPANIQQLLSTLESVSVAAGEVVVEQGDEGEYFYIVKKGRLSVVRQGAVAGKDVLLAELSEGACFGEEALVADTQRNATVTMLTDGVLMRVNKQDFDALLKKPMVQNVALDEARQLVADGACWLDVRLPSEFENCALPESRNLPLSELRERLSELDQAQQYIACCDTGRRSASAAFVLSQHGFDAVVLDQGLMEVPWEELVCGNEADSSGAAEASVDEIEAGTPAPLAESAATAALVSEYVSHIENLEAENKRLTEQRDAQAKKLALLEDQLVNTRKDYESELETTRVAMARAETRQQNVLKEQSRLARKLRDAEQTIETLSAGQLAHADVAEASADHQDTTELEQQLADAQQVLQDREAQVKSLQAKLESERRAIQQVAENGAGVRDKQAALESEITALQASTTKSEQKLVKLQSQLEQMTEQRQEAIEAQRQARQEADQLRAELEVSRGLEAMQVTAQEGTQAMQADMHQLRTELEAEVAQRMLAEKEASRLQAEVIRLGQQLESSQAEHVHSEAVPQMPVMAEEPGSRSANPAVFEAREPQKPVAASSLIQDDDDDLPAPASRKWLIGLLAGAAIGAAVLYFQPDLSQSKNPPQVSEAEQAPAAVPAEALSPQVAAGQGDVSEPALPGTQDQFVTKSVARTVAAIKALDADARAQQELLEKPAQASAGPAVAEQKMHPVRVFSDRLADGSEGPRMVQLPAGEFSMGSQESSPHFDERPDHRVSLAAFSIGKYEVTFDDYDKFAQATGHHLPSDEGWGRGRRPVINVTWDEARAYVDWLSEQTGARYRLPTEAEWEYAARAGTATHYWWGNDGAIGLRANCFDCGSEWDGVQTATVGNFLANPVGLHDMTGNVMEWVMDCYTPGYQNAPANGAAVSLTPCDARVVRGGSYASPLESLRSAARAKRVRQSRIDNLGFRVVRE